MLNKIPFKQFANILLLFALLPISFSVDTLYETTNITDGQILQSTGGVFELALFNLGMLAQWFLGVRYKFSPEIAVWIANPEDPLNHSSGTLAFSKSALTLIDPLENTIWSAGVNSSIGENTNPIVQLLDSGNLVIKDQDKGSILWQSFDYPSNTLLPGMKVGKNLITGQEWSLSSWKSSTDPSKGKYICKMDTMGVPEMTIILNNTTIEFRTGAWNGLGFSGMPGMGTYRSMFHFMFVWSADEVYYSFNGSEGAPLSRVVLTESGVLPRMIWDPTSRTWNEFWYQPKDPCDYYKKCGPYGICNTNSDRLCGCPNGFNRKSPEEWSVRNFSGGCERKTPLSCNADDNGFYLVKGVKEPETHSATVFASISIEECRRRCLANCSCLAYSLWDTVGNGSGCITWSSDLVDIRYVDGGHDLYIKIAKSDLGTSNKNQMAATIGVISSSIILVLLISSFLYLLWRNKRYSKQDKKQKCTVRSDSFEGTGTDLPIFDMDTILQATDNFSIKNKLGEGGFGIVYKGQLPCGQEIAVKRLSRDSQQGLSEFMNEVVLIAKLQHRNLVRLLGCCIDNKERMLIYEFMTNKSLDFFIFDATRCASLNWTMRLEIVIGIARGLLYLHQDSRFNIIHRDLKAANVLLDEEMNPKISDFGTARLFKKEQGVINTETVIGTRGYMSPEYVLEGAFSVKSDVYSFGVLLLEIISGKKNQGNQNLLAYAWKLWKEGNVLELLDEAVESSAPETEMMRYVHVGLLCVQECPDDRPSMSSVFTMLSSDTLLPDPKKPLVGTRIREFPSDWSFYEHHSSTMDLTITGIEGR